MRLMCLIHASYLGILVTRLIYVLCSSYLGALIFLGLFRLVYQKLTIFRGLLKAQQVVLFLCRSENTHKSSRGGENFEAYLKREINLMFLCCIFSSAQP